MTNGLLPKITVDGGALRYNNNKTPISQIPPGFIIELANHFALGMVKHPDLDQQPNWTRGQYYTTVMDSMERHIQKFKAGEAMDTDFITSHHMIAVAWAACVLWFFDTHAELYKDFDDRLWAGMTLNTTYNPDIAKNKNYGQPTAPNQGTKT